MLTEDALRALDARLVEVASGIHVLAHVAWPVEVQQRFLVDWNAGRRRLPEVEYPAIDLADKQAALGHLAEDARRAGGPLGDYLADTATSYRQLAGLLACAGTAEAGAISLDIYGKPGSIIPGSARTCLDAANYFMEVSGHYLAAHASREEDYCLSAEMVAREIKARLADVITDHEVRVVIDPHLASKAAAGATRIRLRAGTCFSQDDIEQLLHHEAFVHSLTGINGRNQPVLTSLSLGAARTTAAQEGLATFAELVTGAIDISRMARLAMRISAIDAALSGADFFDVFESFLAAGQNEVESFNSAARVFRGVPVTGGSAFAKDVVYLTGLLEIHTFFRWALAHRQLNLCERLFAGRMRLSDVTRLTPAFDDGTIAPARYLPPWMTRTNGLTAYLAFSVFGDEIMVADVRPDAFNI